MLEQKTPKVYLVYIDESGDHRLGIFTALLIPVAQWRAAFSMVKQFRRTLKQTDSIYITKEFHAWKFTSGRGQIAPQTITKTRRWEIFRETLKLVTHLPGARLFNSVYPTARVVWGFERLLNRINRTMKEWNSWAIIICDEGKESEYTAIRRRLGIYNPIPSRYGSWGSGSSVKNITIDRIIEDPFFKKSHQSYFIQLVDFCAYSLLCSEDPNRSKNSSHLRDTFQILANSDVLVREANKRDRNGIIRVK